MGVALLGRPKAVCTVTLTAQWKGRDVGQSGRESLTKRQIEIWSSKTEHGCRMGSLEGLPLWPGWG
jgi:hypothetical protein